MLVRVQYTHQQHASFFRGVGIVSGFLAGSPKLKSQKGQEIFLLQNAQTFSQAHPASYRDPCLVIKRPDREADHLLLSNAEARNEWSFTSILSVQFRGVQSRTLFLCFFFTFFFINHSNLAPLLSHVIFTFFLLSNFLLTFSSLPQSFCFFSKFAHYRLLKGP